MAFQLDQGHTVLCRFNTGTLNKMDALLLKSRRERDNLSLKVYTGDGSPSSASGSFPHPEHSLSYSAVFGLRSTHTHVFKEHMLLQMTCIPQTCGIYCGWDRPEGLGDNQTGTFLQSGFVILQGSSEIGTLF